MKAWRIAAHGGLEVLKREEVTTPAAGPMQARIRVEAVGLNHLDLWVRKGVPGHKFPLPITPGCDVVGVIESFGPGAEAAVSARGLAIGSPVILNPGFSCGVCEACLGGFDPLCKQYGIAGEHFDGGCAEMICAPIENLVARPKEIPVAQAAALGVPFLTAWTMLFEKAKLAPGQTILIHAGGSGVSIAAIQMAKMIGATVVTTVGSPEKAQKAKGFGADHVILYRDAKGPRDWRGELKTLGIKACDVVVDHVGVDTFADSLKALAWGGKLVTCGATSGASVSVDLKAVFFKNLSILGSTMGSKALLPKLADLVARGKLRAIVDSEFAMADLPEAHARLESREAFGKIVVKN